MKQKDINEILIPILTDTYSLADKVRFELWLEESEKNREEYLAYKRIWEEAGNKTVYDKFDTKSAFNRVVEKSIANNNRIRIKRQWLAFSVGVAASLLILIGITAVIDFNSSSVEQVEVVAPLGERANITLPDGSHIWLNSGSTLRYKTNFGKGNRDVLLIGEAFFKVEKSVTPFIVEANHKLKVKVYGTRFNVMAYPQELSIETTLEEGSVSLTSTENKGVEEFIEPGEMAIYRVGDRSLTVEKTDPKMYSDWIKGRLVLRDESLIRLARRLERRFNIEIKMDESLKDEDFHLRATFIDESLDEILSAIEQVGGLNCSRDGRTVFISRD
ncbi:FecR family protein [Puteibacter caeruleilacunae]|nr:FecR family protein [Puteibacter caeruleilacunae]